MTNRSHPLVSVVVPAYNESENLPELYRKVVPLLVEQFEGVEIPDDRVESFRVRSQV